VNVVRSVASLAAATFACAGAWTVARADGDDRSPTALYDAALDRWRALPVAPYATYDAAFVVTEKGKLRERRYRVAFRARDGRCLIVGVPVDAHDRPDKTTVSDRCFGPDYAFTFFPQRRNAAGASATGGGLELALPSPEPSADASAPPKTIASVRARARTYAVTFVGDETVDGIATAHLALRPYERPDKHVLRDLWIDRATAGVVRLRGDVSAKAHLVRVIFDASYDETATTQTLRRLSGYAKAQVLFVKIGADVGYHQEHFAFPATLPDWYFDANAYERARAAGQLPVPW
jgi:hypothetical protein